MEGYDRYTIWGPINQRRDAQRGKYAEIERAQAGLNKLRTKNSREIDRIAQEADALAVEFHRLYNEAHEAYDNEDGATDFRVLDRIAEYAIRTPFRSGDGSL